VKPYYDHGGIVIYHGDCRDVLPSIEADVMVTDPPYGVGLKGKKANHRGQTRDSGKGGYLSFDDSLEYVDEVVVPVVASWGRVAVTPGTAAMWLYPKPSDIGCWYSGGGTGLGSWGFRCFQPILYYGKCPYVSSSRGHRPNSTHGIWPNDSNYIDHPCAKPMGFMRWLVVRASLAGETILDPFMGSGTTLRAAKDECRKAIGIEIEEKYCEIAANRLAQEVLPFE